MMKILGMIFVFLLAASLAFSADPSSLAGKWKFNEKESDNPREKFDSGYGGHHEHSAGGGWGGGGGHYGGGDHQGRSGMFQAPAMITISYKAPEFKITDDKGTDRLYYTDGRKSEIEVREGRKMSFTSKWEDDSLIVQSDAFNGNGMSQTYSLSPDKKKLYVKLRMQPMT